MTSRTASRRLPAAIISLFLVLSAGIAATGYMYYREQRAAFGQNVSNELAAIADMKARSIADWRQERIGDAEAICTNPLLAREMRAFLEKPSDATLARDVRVGLEALMRFLDYSNAAVLDAQGVTRLALEARSTARLAYWRDLALEAMRSGKVVFSDPQAAGSRGRILLAVLAPIPGPAAGTGASGAVLLEIDPNRFLYPHIQSWPAPNRTAESLLVRRDDDDALFLSQLRYRANAALKLRIPLSRVDVPGVRGALGFEGVAEGPDYRGVRVLAATRQVPGSSWALVAKVDEEEIYAPLRERAWYVGLLAAFLIAAAGVGAALLWSAQNARFYRQQYEAELRHRARLRHYELLARHANDVILLQDADGEIIEANDRALACYGYERSELIGMNIRRLRAPEAAAEVERHWRELEEQERLLFETVHRRKDGSTFPTEVSAHAIRIDGRRFCLEIARDITRRRQTEEQLRKLSAAVEQSPAIIVITDRSGDIEYVNPRFTELTGYTPEEAIGKNPRILKSGLTPPEEYRQLWETIVAGGEWRGEFCNRKKNGELYWELAVISPIRNQAGEITHFLGVKEDVTERRQLEEDLRQSQKMEAMGQLAGGVAHDFNNLLTVISGYARLVIDRLGGSHPSTGQVRAVLEASDKAAALTQQLLAFSRRQVKDPKVLDLRSIPRGVEQILRRMIGEDVETRIVDGPDPIPVRADRVQLEQVLLNLALNARDAMPQGGTLVIETAALDLDEKAARAVPGLRAGRWAVLTVSDSGCGIEAGILPHIFEPFFTTKEKGKGTGLGLSTVYGVVKQSDGHVAVASEPGRGARFTVYLPRAEQPIEAGSAIREPRATSGTETILLVEDEPAVRKYAVAVLEPQGYRVLESRDVADAEEICRRHPGEIHLLVSDVVMPVLSGPQLAQRLRARRPALRVLYVSGYAESVIANQGVLESGVDLLQKPFPPQALAEKVREILDRPQSPA